MRIIPVFEVQVGDVIRFHGCCAEVTKVRKRDISTVIWTSRLHTESIKCTWNNNVDVGLIGNVRGS